MSLKPQNVIQAAEADLQRRIRNTSPYSTEYEHYAFHRAHVRRAKSVKQLLVLALMHPPMRFDRKTGDTYLLRTNKKNTKLLYGNACLLLEAIRRLDHEVQNQAGDRRCMAVDAAGAAVHA